MYIQITFVFLKISMFVEQVGIVVPSFVNHDYCFPYVTDHNCKSFTIRKCVIINNDCMESFYITDCWKNVDPLEFTSETVNYELSTSLPE
jgi:hypothetical protein